VDFHLSAMEPAWNSRPPARLTEDAQGQATYGMAKLREDRTGLPCIVFIPRKDAARHEVRVKVAPGPRMRADQMRSYALGPFELVEGAGVPPAEERLLARRVAINPPVIVDDREGRIEYTGDAPDLLRSP
jgi:hypothetical protein